MLPTPPVLQNRLNGTLPPDWALPPSLAELDLGSNSLSGWSPCN